MIHRRMAWYPQYNNIIWPGIRNIGYQATTRFHTFRPTERVQAFAWHRTEVNHMLLLLERPAQCPLPRPRLVNLEMKQRDCWNEELQKVEPFMGLGIALGSNLGSSKIAVHIKASCR